MALLTQQHRVSGSEVPLDWEHRVKHDAFTYTATQDYRAEMYPWTGKIRLNMMALLTQQHRVSGREVPLDWEHQVKHNGFTYTATQGIGQ